MKLIATIIACFVLTLGMNAQDLAKKTAVKKLLAASGSVNMGMQAANQIIESFKQSFPDVDSTIWIDFRKEIKDEDLESIVVPIYEKYYSLEELKFITDFFTSPIGKKMVEKSPAIMDESYKAGEEWGKKIAENIIEKLKAKGLIKDEQK